MGEIEPIAVDDPADRVTAPVALDRADAGSRPPAATATGPAHFCFRPPTVAALRSAGGRLLTVARLGGGCGALTGGEHGVALRSVRKHGGGAG